MKRTTAFVKAGFYIYMKPKNETRWEMMDRYCYPTFEDAEKATDELRSLAYSNYNFEVRAKL
jgi:hypothetical protein